MNDDTDQQYLQQNEAAEQDLAPLIRILKIATCPSLSGRSTLTYHIGCFANVAQGGGGVAPEIQFRVYANTGKGLFNQDWVPISDIQKAINGRGKNAELSSTLFHEIFKGKSLNTSGFLFAILKAEGLVARMEDRPRYYQAVVSEKFIGDIEALMASDICLDPDQPLMSPVVMDKKGKKSR